MKAKPFSVYKQDPYVEETRKANRIANRSIWVNTGLLICTLFASGAAIWQSITARSAYDDARTTFEISNRPFLQLQRVDIKIDTQKRRSFFATQIENLGNYTVETLTFETFLDVVPPELINDSTELNKNTPIKSDIHGYIVKGIPSTFTADFPDSIYHNRQLLQLFTEGSLIYVFRGRIRYKNPIKPNTVLIYEFTEVLENKRDAKLIRNENFEETID